MTQSESYSYVANTQRLDRVTYYTGKYKQYSWTENGELAREDNYENSALTTSQVYTWGIGGTLVEVRFESGDQDGCKVNYEYDSDNELIGRTVTLKNGNVTESERYLVDHQNPTGYSQRLAVLDNLSGSIRHEIFTDELAAETTVNSGTANTQYPHADALGSVRSLTGKSAAGENLGTSAERHFYDYTAFGSSLRGDRSLTNYAFTGQIIENHAELQYHRARWLFTDNARWISVDGFFDFPLNYGGNYSYLGSNPISSVDYTGLFSLVEMANNVSLLAIMATPAIKSYLSGGTTKDVAGAAVGGVIDAIKGLWSLSSQVVIALAFLDFQTLGQIIGAIITGMFDEIIEFISLIVEAFHQHEYAVMVILGVLLVASIIGIIFAFKTGPKNKAAVNKIGKEAEELGASTAVKNMVQKYKKIEPKKPRDIFPYEKHPSSKVLHPGVSPGEYVLVRDIDGVIHIADNGPHMHPKTLGGGQSATAAGEIKIGPDLKIDEVSNVSGTFRFGKEMVDDVVEQLKDMGYDVSNTKKYNIEW